MAKRWSELSDDELVAASFTVDDPKSLDRLLDALPDRTEVPHAEYAYNTKASGLGPVRCVICKNIFENHFHGFVLVYANGDRILVGKDCAKKHYGHEFTHRERDFNQAKERAAYLRQRIQVLAGRGPLLKGLERMAADTACQQFADLRKTLNRNMGPIAADLATSAVRNSGTLTYEVQVRDFTAEEREAEEEVKRRERAGKAHLPPKKRRPIWKAEERVFGALVGIEFFWPAAAPAGSVREIAGGMAAVLDRFEEASDVLRMRTALKELRGLCARVREQFARLEAVPTAMGIANLTLIASWAKARGLSGYEMRGEALTYRNEDSGIVEWSMPGDYAPPRKDFLPAFEAALGSPSAKAPA